MNLNIGHKVKELRQKRQMTLKELSERSGLSIAYLSQFERGLSPINVDTLQIVATSLDVNLYYFIGAPKSSGKPIVHKHERTVHLVEEGCHVHYNLSDIENESAFIPRFVDLYPSSSKEREYPAYPHQGEEFIYVLQGTLELWVDNQQYFLEKGDSAHYPSTLPHKWLNPTSSMVQLLTINDTNFYVSS